MKKAVLLTAVLSSGFTMLVMRGWGETRLPAKVLLENAKVRVTETTYLPGTPREASVRATDQVIVFLDESRYERKDSKTGEKTVRTRKSGETIWHDKGEDAPQLTNLGTQPYRTVMIELLR